MSFEVDFLEFMPYVVSVAPYAGPDDYNKPTYGSPVEYQARIVGKHIALRTPTGEQITPILDIYLASYGATFTVQDLVTLPSGDVWVDVNPVIFAVAQYPDPDGVHHAKIQCGWMYHRQGQ